MSDIASAREIIERLVKQSGITKKLAAEILHIIPDLIEEGLKKDGEVRVKGLGTFRLKQVKKRIGRNPRTGERVEIPLHARIVFLPEQSFKEYINRDYRLLSYKIIPPAEKIPQVDEIIPEPEPGYQSIPQYTTEQEQEPEPEKKYEPWPLSDPEPEPEPELHAPKKRRRIHWIVPVAISVIIVLSLIFYFRNFYHTSRQSPVVSRQSSVVSQQSAVISQQPADSNQQSEISNLKAKISSPPSALSSEREITIEGQHLFQLAREVYGTPYLWVLIYRANQDKITNPDILISGMKLVIPSLEGTPAHLTRADSLGISDGYRLIYEYFSSKKDPRTNDYFQAIKQYKPM